MKYLLALVMVTSLYAGKLSDAMMEKLSKAGPGESIQALVWMKQQADLSGIKGYKAKAEVLKTVARNSQRDVISFLSSEDVAEYESFWLVNMLYVKATPEVIVELAKREDVALVDVVRERHIIMPKKSFKDIPQEKSVEWNITKIKADSVWSAYGLSGDGVIVGTMDTGIDPSHPALSGNFSGYFFDAVNDRTTPYDDHGHGTHVAGTIAGGDGPGPFTNDIGVAYRAQIASAKAFNSGGSGQDQDIIECFQWFVSLKVDSGVDIKAVSNSWGSTDETDTTFLPFVRAWHEFDIIPVFASGNSGPGSGSAGTPGNFPNVIGVGATDINDNIASFSSRGPAPNQYPWSDTTLWSRPDWNFIKPDISAPGVNVRSSTPGGGYESWDGTSMATPHVTGVIALMFELNPSLDYSTIYDILTNYGVDHPAGNTYPNNDYGWGRINALKVIESTPTLDAPYLRLLQPVYDDASGNGNGMPDPGESVTMTIPLRNLGLDVLNVNATISTDNPLITITDNSSFYGDIPHDSIVSGDGFSFSVDSTWRAGLAAQFVITITGSDTSMTGYTKVDTITVVIGQPTYYPWYVQDFESSLPDWVLTGSWGITTSYAHSGNGSLTDSPNGQYPNNANYYAMLATPIDLSDAYFARLHFWQRYEFESGFDYGYVQAATDPNGEWTNLASVNGSQSTWEEVFVNLSPFVGSTTVYIRFLITSDGSITRDGWYIDDLTIEKDLPLEGVVVSFTGISVLDESGNGVIDPGESGRFLVTLRNIGTQDAGNVSVSLSTQDTFLQVLDSTAFIPSIPANGGEVSDTMFFVQASPSTPREHSAELTITLVDSSGYTKSINYTLTIGQMTVNDPSGPDSYGYYAYENNDSSYSPAPVFNWIEIAPAAGGSGTVIQLGDDDDQLVNLPFTFNYYGASFTQITIGSNGNLAMGSENARDFSNSGIPNSDGPSNMIAPLWDDLNPSRGGQVAYYYDSDNHIFIVEWYQVPHFAHSNEVETFQVLLYDPMYYTTPTGDGEIVFQYLSDPMQDDFTTGIENASETDGIQIYYDGVSDRLATGISAGKAIKFTTLPPTVGVGEGALKPVKFFFDVTPNPVVRRGKISFVIPAATDVKIRLYDVSGRVVSKLYEGRMEAGNHSIDWSTEKIRGGVYFLSIEAGNYSKTRKIVILK